MFVQGLLALYIRLNAFGRPFALALGFAASGLANAAPEPARASTAIQPAHVVALAGLAARQSALASTSRP